MEVTIQERSISLTSEYDISAPSLTYYARRTFFSLTDNIELSGPGGDLLVKIEGEISPLRHRHEFRFTDGRVYEFSCEKIWKQVFTCEGKSELYKLYEHTGVTYSVFRADRQIAAAVRNRLIFGKGNQYEIRMDSDADVLVVVSMMLAINSSQNDDDRGITIDFGRIGPEETPFDESWEPR